MVESHLLWQLVDRWEDRWRDDGGGYVAKMVWKQAWEELLNVMGERFPSKSDRRERDRVRERDDENGQRVDGACDTGCCAPGDADGE